MVMKAVSKEEVVKDDVLHQLRREVEIHSRCRHENIVRFFCYFTDEERVFMILEYCNGKTLLERIRSSESGRLPEDECRDYMRQLVAALTYLREDKAVPIIHRDIKPENLMLCKDKKTGKRTLKLGDFGWAVQHVPTSVRLTLCGTPEYLPPEVCMSERYSGAFDIWTMGILMYEMLAGHTPFAAAAAAGAAHGKDGDEEEDELEAITRRIAESEGVPVPSHFSAEARDLVLRLLEKDPASRILLEDVAKHPFLA